MHQRLRGIPGKEDGGGRMNQKLKEETTMKKTMSILLILALVCGCAIALADSEWTDYHCEKDGFSTKIPLNALTEISTGAVTSASLYSTFTSVDHGHC